VLNYGNIQSATAENRRRRIGEEKDTKKKKKKPQDENIMACPIPQGGHNNLLNYDTVGKLH